MRETQGFARFIKEIIGVEEIVISHEEVVKACSKFYLATGKDSRIVYNTSNEKITVSFSDKTMLDNHTFADQLNQFCNKWNKP